MKNSTSEPGTFNENFFDFYTIINFIVLIAVAILLANGPHANGGGNIVK
jgi:hypothetical protein